MDVTKFPAGSSIISVRDDEGSTNVRDDEGSTRVRDDVLGPRTAAFLYTVLFGNFFDGIWRFISDVERVVEFFKALARVVVDIRNFVGKSVRNAFKSVRDALTLVGYSFVLLVVFVVIVVVIVLAGLKRIYDFLLPEKVRVFVDKVLGYAFAVFGSFVLLVVGVVVILLWPLAYTASRWKGIFILSCLAVSFDSLFLYIPIIDEEHNCLGMDTPLRNVALALRSVTDLTFIFHIACRICGLMNKCPNWSDSGLKSVRSQLNAPTLILNNVRKAMTEKIKWLSFSVIINFVAILPFPQLAVIAGFFRMGSFYRSQIMNKVLIFQYLLRSCQIIISIKKMHTAGKWFKGASYFLLYFIASHVLGAFWYFFSIQLKLSCWDEVCQTIAGCMSVYHCGHNTSLNSMYLSESCPIDASNATTFDFGMYRDVLKSGNMGHTDFSAKFFYYFWWSLKNISNFGTNLETSSDMWENCFAIFICAIGLLLFIILIGNVQTYIQSETEKSLTMKEKRRMRLNKKYEEIEKWLSTHGYPDDDIQKPKSWKNLKEVKVVEFIDKEVDLEFVRNCYNRHPSARDPLNVICLHALKKVSILRYVDEQELKKFCVERVDCTTLEENDCIPKADQQLDALYLITDGTIEDVQTQRRRNCCGEEVLRWAILNYEKPKDKYDILPNPTSTVKCLTKIEAFKFTSDVLIAILRKLKNPQQLLSDHQSRTTEGIKDWLLINVFPEDLKANIMRHLNQNNLLAKGHMDADVDVDSLLRNLPDEMRPFIKRHLGMNALKEVPMLQTFPEYIFEIICTHMEPKVYQKDDYLVRANEPLGFMIFILGGKVIVIDRAKSNATTTNSSQITENILDRGGYYGDKLLSWASPNNVSSSNMAVISTRDVICQTNVEALILRAEDLKSVAYICGPQWNFDNCMNSQQLVHDGRDRVAIAAPSPTMKESIRLHHDIILEQLVLLRETVFQKLDDHGQKLDNQGRKLDDQGRRLDDMVAYLATLGYTGSTHTSFTRPAPQGFM